MVKSIVQRQKLGRKSPSWDSGAGRYRAFLVFLLFCLVWCQSTSGMLLQQLRYPHNTESSEDASQIDCCHNQIKI